MRIMAVDYGESRTGIAVCDPTEFLRSPVCIIKEKNTLKAIEKRRKKQKSLMRTCCCGSPIQYGRQQRRASAKVRVCGRGN